MIFFISDYHFDHRNIITYCNRPFKDVKEMNDCLIENHNSVVNESDTVFILGDFGFQKSVLDITKKLKGKKHLILGNHDRDKPNLYLKNGFESVHTSLLLSPSSIFPEIDRCLYLVHDPNYKIQVVNIPCLCGHVHNNIDHYGTAVWPNGCLNMSVEMWEYTPVQINKVIEKLEDKEGE